MSKFEELFGINVNEHTEQRQDLTYLSWAWALAEMTKRCPDMSYEVLKFDNGNGVVLPYMYDENTGYMCWTRVTVEGQTKECWLPVMDSNNHAMKKDAYVIKTKYKEVEVKGATMFDVNKTIMRCLTKNFAMFGLGLYIYAGEDLPELPQEVQDGAETLKKEITKEKAKETREFNKEVKKASVSEDGLKLRYESAMAVLVKMKDISPVRDAKLIERATALMNDLSDAGMETERQKIYDELNSRMLKVVDELPTFA